MEIKEYPIPIAWGVDEKYVLPAFVVMYSILENSEHQYDFYILTNDKIENQVSEYTERLEQKYSNFSVSIRYVDRDLFTDAKIYKEHLSIAAYYRLLLPEVLERYEKCIYLDCDVLVNGDLSELYDIDIGNNYLAGVKDCHIIEDTPYQQEHKKVLGIPSKDKYINSGVMLMNLKKMREDRMVSRFWRQMERENWYEDQDVLNYCCYPDIKLLPLKYNLFHFYCGKSICRLYHLDYSQEDFEFNEPFIIHMGAKWKPWFSRKVKYADKWWELAEVFSGLEYYEKYKQLSRKDEYEVLIESLKANKGRKFVICGYTRFGIRLCNMILAQGYNNIVAIADNDKEKWKESYQGIRVMGMAQACKQYEDVFWIVSNQRSFELVRCELITLGINSKDIVRYVDYCTNAMYLLSLDERFYDSEIEKISDFEYPQNVDRKEYVQQIVDNPGRFSEEYEYLKKRYCFQYWYHVDSEGVSR